jgi:4-amino-4-deoxy-L-arabinose transferase-like glycosyltransferase
MTLLARHRWLGAILLIYALLSLYQLDLPGLHYDEAFEAVPAVQLLHQQPLTLFRNSGLTIGDQTYPLMTQDYIGAINTYTSLPFIAGLGTTPQALRLPSVMIGAVTLSLAYILTTRLSGDRRVGLAAALLLAVDPTFIFWNRQGIFVTAVTAPLGLGAAYCWLRRLERGNPSWGLAGAFLFGLGLYAKLLFIWLIAALAGALILLNLPWLIRRKLFQPLAGLNLTIKESLWLGLAFLAGCWPLVLYNLQTGGTWLSLAENARTSYYGVDNSAWGANLGERLKQFGTLLNGSHLWYLGEVKSNPLPLFSFILILLGIGLPILLATRRKLAGETGRRPDLRRTLLPFVVIGLVILASIQTVSALWITHYALLMPWPAIALAGGGWYIGKHWPQLKRRSPISRLGLGLLLLLAGSNLLNTIRYHHVLSRSGGLSAHSDAIYDLSDWLVGTAQTSAGQITVAAMDWGLAAPVTYLTAGQVSPIEVFGYAWQPDADLTARLVTFIDRPQTYYLWRAPDEIIFDRSQPFKALYRPLALAETIEAAFYERSGRPILGITRLLPCGRPGLQSPEPASHCP